MREDLTGRRFGSIVVLSFAGTKGKYPLTYWLCKCDCGKEFKARASHLKDGSTKSCRCSIGGHANKRHGESMGYRGVDGLKFKYGTKEWRCWQGIKRRCTDPNVANYHLYGGRGIKICQEWADNYVAFLAYVGRAPSPKHSLDRIDNNGNYEPGNVCWANALQQAANRRRAKIKSCDVVNAVLAFGG